MNRDENIPKMEAAASGDFLVYVEHLGMPQCMQSSGNVLYTVCEIRLLEH